MGDYTPPIVNGEAKFFSSHEAGGTGLMVCKTSGSRGNELTFLPNVSTTGKSTWRWATSGIVPQPKQYYHVVGVWDKEQLGMGYMLRHSYECFAVARMPQWKPVNRSVYDVWRIKWGPTARKTGHQAEKPVELIGLAVAT